MGQVSKGDEQILNYSKEGAEEGAQQVDVSVCVRGVCVHVHLCSCICVFCCLLTQMSVVGSMKGELAGLDTFAASASSNTKQSSSSGGGGMFGFFKALSGGKTITMETLQPILEKMKEHLIGEFQSCNQVTLLKPVSLRQTVQ